MIVLAAEKTICRSDETTFKEVRSLAEIVIATDVSRVQVFSAIKNIRPLSKGCRLFLEHLCFLRNPKRGARIYSKISSLALAHHCTPRTIKRYIKEAESAGLLYVQGQHNGRRQINNAYEFTKLIFDQNNAELKKTILAEPPRKSKGMNLKIAYRENERLAPLALHGRPGCQECHPKTLSPYKGINKELSLSLSDSTDHNPPPRSPITPRSQFAAPKASEVVFQNPRRERRPKREPIEQGESKTPDELDSLCNEFTTAMGRRPMNTFCRRRFKQTAGEKKIPIDVLTSRLKELMANPLLKASTSGLNRLFYFDEALAMERRMWGKFEGKEFVSKELSDILPTAALQTAWMQYKKQKFAVQDLEKRRAEDAKRRDKIKREDEERKLRMSQPVRKTLREMMNDQMNERR